VYFIVLLGIVSLFGDVTYEGARSVIGPYLATLGASASIVGLISGIGEFSGYALRLASGYLADRTKAYWLFTFIGYGLLLSLAGICWLLAACCRPYHFGTDGESNKKSSKGHHAFLCHKKGGEGLGVCCS